MTEVIKPSVILSETHFHSRSLKGVLSGAVERIGHEGFFRSVELPDIKDREDRKRIYQAMNRFRLDITTWMSFVFMEEDLNLSSLDESIRKKTVHRITEKIDEAIESGSVRFGLLNGPDPGAKLRRIATESLYTSLCELCQALEKRGDYRLILEPLDRGAHKNGLIGPTGELLGLIERVRESYSNIFVNWDAAHAALNGEDIIGSFTAAAHLTDGIHLSNAVIDRSNAAFGDHHIRIGEKGFLTIETIAKLFQKASESGWFGKERRWAAVEARSSKDDCPWETVNYCQDILLKAWESYLTKYKA